MLVNLDYFHFLGFMFDEIRFKIVAVRNSERVKAYGSVRVMSDVGYKSCWKCKQQGCFGD